MSSQRFPSFNVTKLHSTRDMLQVITRFSNKKLNQIQNSKFILKHNITLICIIRSNNIFHMKIQHLNFMFTKKQKYTEIDGD